MNVPTNWIPKLGTFSKATAGAVAANFSESGGANCSNSCPLKKSGKCYAMATEKRKPNIEISGTRKRKLGFIACLKYYTFQLSMAAGLPWIRVSSFGSVPNTPTAGDLDALGDFLKTARRVAAGVHFPIESYRKYKKYVNTCNAAGVILRLSTAGKGFKYNMAKIRAGVKCATVIDVNRAPDNTRLETVKEHVRRCRVITSQYKAAGVRVILCPAVVSSLLKAGPVKCGDCTACSRGNVELIVYPEH